MRLVRLPQQPEFRTSCLRRRKAGNSRAARPWEFLAAVGKRAGLFGYESGVSRPGTYPLKMCATCAADDSTEGREIPAETLVRTVVARPESTTLVYTNDTSRFANVFLCRSINRER